MLKKWVKMFLEVKDIFVIVKSCGKTFILKSNGRNYDEEFKKKQWDYILKIIVQGSCKTFKNLNKYVFKMDV